MALYEISFKILLLEYYNKQKEFCTALETFFRYTTGEIQTSINAIGNSRIPYDYFTF